MTEEKKRGRREVLKIKDGIKEVRVRRIVGGGESRG